MARTSYLRFNPDTREIELEGSEAFIKAYFDKLQQKLPTAPGGQKRGSGALEILPAKKARVKTTVKAAIEIPAPKKVVTAKAKTKTKAEIPTPKKVVKAVSKKTTARKPKEASLIDKIVGLVQGSETGITTDELKDKTGMTAKQIWSITSRAVKLQKIRTTKRGDMNRNYLFFPLV
jgi:hypothetical protein